MPGVNPYLEAGPDSWEVALPVAGGQMVMVDTTDTAKQKVIPTTGPVTTCLGQALIDALPKADMGTDMARLRAHTSVRYSPMDAPVTFLNACAPGDLVMTASLGRVQKYDTAVGSATPAHIIGRCTQPGGVAAGAKGRVRFGF